MLSRADAELCARDIDLPGLAAVLDAQSLARKAGLGPLRATYLRYKPGTSCVAGLMPEGGGLGAYAAMTYTPARYAEVRTRAEWRTGPHPALFFDDLFTALVPLAHDRHLAAAHMLQSADRLGRFLSKLGLEGAELSLLRYKPGRRLVLRAQLPTGAAALVKAHAEPDFRGALDGARHGERAAGIRVLGIRPKRHSIAVEWIEGNQLDPARATPDQLVATGRELARLHAAPGEAHAGRSMAGTDTEAVASLVPGLGPDAARTAARIDRALAALTPRPCTIHGDFSADQVVMSGDGPVVIDWDRISVADPGRDIGTFLARLDADVIEGAISARAAADAEDAFVGGYATEAGSLPPGLRAYRAAAVLALAPQSFRDRRPDWPAEIAALISRADALVRHRTPRPAPRALALSDALDIATMGPKLVDATGVQAPCTAARLLRRKAGRRALVRYELSDGQTLLGKLRAKGPDRRTPKLHHALREAGLDGSMPHRVGVPEVLGEIDDPALWLQRLVPGRVLTDLIGGAAGTKAARLAGQALARLHDADVPGERAWGVDDELDVLNGALGSAATARPDLASDIATLRTGISDALRSLPAGPTTAIHRDFYPDQVLVDGGAVWLLDLDLYAQGDPVLDLGNFVAHLTELGMRHDLDPGRYGAEARAFLDGYGSVRGAPDPERVAMLHWVSLARHIGLSQRIAGRGHTTAPLVAICAAGPSAPVFMPGHPRHRSPAA